MSFNGVLPSRGRFRRLYHFICRYSSTEEYYRDGSSQHYIPHITTPALFLCAEDDPFLGRLPVEECSANPNTILAVTARFVSPRSVPLGNLHHTGTQRRQYSTVPFVLSLSD